MLLVNPSESKSKNYKKVCTLMNGLVEQMRPGVELGSLYE